MEWYNFPFNTSFGGSHHCNQNIYQVSSEDYDGQGVNATVDEANINFWDLKLRSYLSKWKNVNVSFLFIVSTYESVLKWRDWRPLRHNFIISPQFRYCENWSKANLVKSFVHGNLICESFDAECNSYLIIFKKLDVWFVCVNTFLVIIVNINYATHIK